jgi:hypothetical protein
MDETQNIQIPLGEYLALKELEKKGQSIKYEQTVYHNQKGQLGYTTSSISWHLPGDDDETDLVRSLCSDISSLITQNKTLNSILEDLVTDVYNMNWKELRKWQHKVGVDTKLADFIKEEYIVTGETDDVYKKQQEEIDELKALVRSIASQSQMALDKPKYKLSEEHIKGIREVVGDIKAEEKADDTSTNRS